MKALDKNKQVLEEIDTLISMMRMEIDLLRSLVSRYYLKYGNEIYEGEIKLPDNVYFSQDYSAGNVFCRLIDTEKTKIRSRFEKIQETISHLS